MRCTLDKSEIAVVDLAVARPSHGPAGMEVVECIGWWAPTAARPTTSV